MAQKYAIVENLIIEKSPASGDPLVFEVGNTCVYEAKIVNGESSVDIYVTTGFAYFENTVIFPLSIEKQTIGSPLPGEVIDPFGEVECTQDVMDAALNGKDIVFLCSTAHYTGVGYVVDSTYSINVAMKKPDNGNGNGKIDWTKLIIMGFIIYVIFSSME